MESTTAYVKIKGNVKHFGDPGACNLINCLQRCHSGMRCIVGIVGMVPVGGETVNFVLSVQTGHNDSL